MNWLIKPRRGLESKLNAANLELGEIAYAIDTGKLAVGNPEIEKGYEFVTELVVGPDDLLYAELENHAKRIPIGIVDRKINSILGFKTRKEN